MRFLKKIQIIQKYMTKYINTLNKNFSKMYLAGGLVHSLSLVQFDL